MSSDGRRRVNFSDSPPERDIQRQWNDLGALQDAYAAVYESERRLKARFKELEEENFKLRKHAKEDESRWRELHDEIRTLKEEKDKFDSDRKLLAEENAQLKGKNNALNTELDEYISLADELTRKLNESPVPEVMTPAIPTRGDAAPPKMKRRDSVSKKRDSKREEKDAEKEKKRLSKRFDLDKGETSKPPNSSRTRRQSYIEPLGPSAPSTRGSVPPSPTMASTPTTRQFTSYSQAPFRETSYSDLPRTVHPSVHPSVAVHEPVFDEGVAWQEDGKYHPYPLPPKPKSRHHRG